MTHNASAKRAIIDARISTIASQAVTGEIEDTTARWMIIEMLGTADYDQMISHRSSAQHSLTPQEVDDLALRLRALIERKALQTDFLDLNRFVTSSACGWAYNLSSAAVASEIRNMRRHTSRVLSVDPMFATANANSDDHYLRAEERAYAESSTGVDDLLDSFAAPAPEDFNAIEDEFTKANAGSRNVPEDADDLAHAFNAARALRKAYNLPELNRPEYPVDREFILDALRTDPRAAYESARAMYDLIEGVSTDEQRKIDDRLIDLWAEYSVQDLHDLLSKDAKVAAALAKAAVSMLARPSRDVLAAALTAIREVGDSENWRAFTRALFDSWVAVECEATSRFNTKIVDAKIEEERATARMSAALAWPELAQQAADLPGRPFGYSPREVADFIRVIVTSLL